MSKLQKNQLLLLERGHGDSVEEIAHYWREATIDDIYRRVASWASSTLDEQHPHAK